MCRRSPRAIARGVTPARSPREIRGDELRGDVDAADDIWWRIGNLDRILAAIFARFDQPHEFADVVACLIVVVEPIDFRGDEAGIGQQLAGGLDPLRLV